MLKWEYDQEAEHKAIREDSLEEGWEKGREEERIDIVKNGLENNIPIETISIMTGVSIEEIETIRDKVT